MAKLSSPRMELAALRAACSPDPVISGAILGSIDESHFYPEEAKEIFELIKKRRNEVGSTPRYKVLLEDPELSSEAAKHFRNSEILITDRREAEKALANLNEFRRRRGLYNMAQYLGDELNKPKPQTQSAMEKVSESLARIRATQDKSEFIHLGRNDNSSKMIQEILWGDKKDSVIPTGFKTFDDVNGGFFRGSLITIGATTSGGKSTVANQLAVNFAQNGYKVHVVPLEMTAEEMMARIMSTVTKFDSLNIMLQRMTEAEKILVNKRMMRWRKKVHEKGGRYTIYRPKEDVTIEDLMASLHSFSSDVIIIDYISLLAGVGGDDAWQKLGQVARFAKIYAANTNRVVILLAQVSEDGKLRYSRAVQEHANNSWIWVTTAETREQGIIKVSQPKARNQKAFDFTLRMESDYMRVYDMPNEGVDENVDEPQRKKRNNEEVINLASTL